MIAIVKALYKYHYRYRHYSEILFYLYQKMLSLWESKPHNLRVFSKISIRIMKKELYFILFSFSFLFWEIRLGLV